MKHNPISVNNASALAADNYKPCSATVSAFAVNGGADGYKPYAAMVSGLTSALFDVAASLARFSKNRGGASTR